MDISAIVSDLTSGDQQKAFRAELELRDQTAAVGAKDQSEKRKELAAALAKAIEETEPKYDNRGNPTEASLNTVQARNTLIRYFALVASDEQVPVLAKLLHQQDNREMARWALERMTGPAAAAALADAAINSVGDRFRIGVIHALAAKQGEQALNALKKCCTDGNVEVRLAAAKALAQHADADADAAIAQAAKRGGKRAKLAVAKARLRLADRLLHAGHQAAAKKICDEIKAEESLPAQAAAAKILLQRTS